MTIRRPWLASGFAFVHATGHPRQPWKSCVAVPMLAVLSGLNRSDRPTREIRHRKQVTKDSANTFAVGKQCFEHSCNAPGTSCPVNFGRVSFIPFPRCWFDNEQLHSLQSWSAWVKCLNVEKGRLLANKLTPQIFNARHSWIALCSSGSLLKSL